MKQIRLILAIVLGALFSLSVNAGTVLTEQFVDYNTGALGSTGTGGGGTIPGWYSSRSHIVVTNGSGSLDGTGVGLVESAGDMVYILSSAQDNLHPFDTNSGGIPNGCYNKFCNKYAPPPAFTATNPTPYSLYTSFLYQFNDNTNFPADGVSMIAGMYLQSGGIQSGSPGGSDAYWQLLARTNATGNLQVGLTKNLYGPTPGVTNWAADSLPVGQTFFVVVRLQIATTNNVNYSTNDEADLWINPAPQYFGTNEDNVPTPSAISPPGDGAPPSSPTGPGRFFVVDNGLSANLDELRIATNWAEATPPLGQCLSATNGFSVQPTNITQSAEISAVLTARAVNTTSPHYQWQLSQDSGSTWANIAGAISTTYYTPNLQYATDNGNEYRCVIHVACNNSYATSDVATVTLTQPTPTPSPSVLMDDTFGSTTYRDVGPVTTSPYHSVWYTSSDYTSDFYTDPYGTGLIAIPQAGKSTLYLGYFINEATNSMVPADLAIGTQITASLKFIPSSFSSFTNNGALRFGLFDYADSGTLVDADSTLLTGSTGEGDNVRGYMLSLDFGQIFSDNTPLNLYVRNGLGDPNLIGTTGDYLSIGSGPLSGAYSNTAAFQAGTTYTVTLTVARTDTNTCSVTATVTGGSLNLTATGVDTNNFGYHRFDTMAVRPNKLENAPDQFTFPEFKVLVTNAPPQVSGVTIGSVSRAGNDTTLTWQATPGNADVSAGFSVTRKDSLSDTNWTTLQSGITTTNYTDTTATNSSAFYRVTYP